MNKHIVIIKQNGELKYMANSEEKVTYIDLDLGLPKEFSFSKIAPASKELSDSVKEKIELIKKSIDNEGGK